MTKKSNYLFITAFMSLIIPTPGRFVFGFTVLFELFFLSVIGTIFINFFPKFKIKEMKTFLFLFLLISLSVFYRQIMIIWQTEVAFILGIIFYFPPLSLFLITVILEDSEESLYGRMKNNLKQVSVFCIMGLLLFLFRDLLSFGTFTFFGKNHCIYEKVIINSDRILFLHFFASIPGVLILSGVILLFVKIILTKIRAIENLEAHDALS